MPQKEDFIQRMPLLITLLSLSMKRAVAGIEAGLDDVSAGRVQPLDEAFESYLSEHSGLRRTDLRHPTLWA